MLRIESLSKSYGDNPAIGDVGFEVSGREFVCVVGPSGCGKSTLLNILSGVETPSGGTVSVKEGDRPARLGAPLRHGRGRTLPPSPTQRRGPPAPKR